jgi:hypothetical protein
MSGRQLSSTVTVTGEDGLFVTFGPGDHIPGWAAKQIDNPKAWADTDESAPEPVRGGPVDLSTGAGSDGENPHGLPPKAGSGSGLDAWVAKATELGITVPENPSRGDVIELVEQHLAANPPQA